MSTARGYMLQNKNRKKVKTKVSEAIENTLLLKKLPGLLALCELALIPFFVVSPSISVGAGHDNAPENVGPGLVPGRGVSQGHALRVERSLSATTPSEVQIAAVPEPILEPKEVIEVTVTAYSSTEDQTDNTPFHTANGKDVKDGIVAANFLKLGTQLRIPEVFGDKIFTVEDRMHERFDRHLDIWMSSREVAKEFGIRYLTVEIL